MDVALHVPRGHCLAPERIDEGAVGGRIVAEVLHGVIAADPRLRRSRLLSVAFVARFS